jgi:hypothetical protein
MNGSTNDARKHRQPHHRVLGGPANADDAISLQARRDLLRYLTSEKCHCGKPKRQGVSFCAQCVYSLPVSITAALYKKLGHGYEEAHERACRALDER